MAIAAVCKTVTLETPKVRLLLSPRCRIATGEQVTGGCPAKIKIAISVALCQRLKCRHTAYGNAHWDVAQMERAVSF